MRFTKRRDDFCAMLKPAVFFDRDGTLIEEKEYLRRAEDIFVYPEALSAVRKINQSGALAVVITNQSAVARGFLTEEQLQELHRLLADVFRENGARIDAFYYCPHHPEAGEGPYTQACTCRKPEPGLLLQAAQDLEIDLASSYFIGDRFLDVETARRAGCRPVLVKTGYGAKELQLSGETPPPGPDYIADSILDAVEWILLQ